MLIELDIKSDVIYYRGKKAIIAEMLKDGVLFLEKIAAFAKVNVENVVAIQQEINTK